MLRLLGTLLPTLRSALRTRTDLAPENLALGQQLAALRQQVVGAFPWESAPRHLLRDRDSIFGGFFRSRVRGMGIEEDCPEPRAVQPPEMGEVVEFPEVGGLHHRYERRAA